MTAPTPIIFGLAGTALSDAERAFFKACNPAGYILFRRNIETPDQVRALCDSLHGLHGRRMPILIDQEGGRVQRLRAPMFTETPALRTYAAHPTTLRADQTCLARQLADLGITVNCTPCLDMVPDGIETDAIGDRSFGNDPEMIGRLGWAVCDAHLAENITPVIKHLPGHGRALVDSHYALPTVQRDDRDFIPFRAVAEAVPQAWGMTTHIVFPEVDPEFPATLSAKVIAELIRGGCGFKGLLLTDDLYMGALEKYGDVPARVAASLTAGCDIALHCHGDVADMERAAAACPPMRDSAAQILERWAQ